MGAPLLANPQMGTYYPPNWPTTPFRAPTAIAISILLHTALAAAGTCFLYLEAVSRRWIPALAAGVIFAFGGYLGAHVEQINQLQGLAWMPILFALYHRILTRGHPRRDALLLAMAWALQIFSGHTQTVFISGVGMAIYGMSFAITAGTHDGRRARMFRALLLLAACFTTALLLALPQLLPSLELLRLSNRSGGFDLQNATAFSLPPNVLGRALLPSYDGAVIRRIRQLHRHHQLGTRNLGYGFRSARGSPQMDLDAAGGARIGAGIGSLQSNLSAAGGIAGFQSLSRAGAFPGALQSGDGGAGGKGYRIAGSSRGNRSPGDFAGSRRSPPLSLCWSS